MGTVVAAEMWDDDGPRAVEVPATADTPAAVVRFLVGRLVEQGRVPATELERAVESVMRRESLGATAIGRGLAVPHGVCGAIERAVYVMGRLSRPIMWAAWYEELVDTVALVLSPDSNVSTQLRALEELVRRLRAKYPPDANP